MIATFDDERGLRDESLEANRAGFLANFNLGKGGFRTHFNRVSSFLGSSDSLEGGLLPDLGWKKFSIFYEKFC